MLSHSFWCGVCQSIDTFHFLRLTISHWICVSGTIPVTIGKLTSLTSLHLEVNKLSGAIYREMTPSPKCVLSTHWHVPFFPIVDFSLNMRYRRNPCHNRKPHEFNRAVLALQQAGRCVYARIRVSEYVRSVNPLTRSIYSEWRFLTELAFQGLFLLRLESLRG